MAHRDGLVSEEIGVVDLRLRRQAFFSLTDTIARYSTGYVPYRTSDSYGFLEMRAGSEGDWAVNGDSLLAVVSGEPPTLTWWRSGETKDLPGLARLNCPWTRNRSLKTT